MSEHIHDDPRHDDARQQLVLASLPHVAFDGWSSKALLAGGRDLGLTAGAVANLCPGGAGEAIEAFSDWADDAMVGSFAEGELESLPVRVRIHALVTARLQALEPHAEAVRRGTAWLALPQNAPLGARLIWRTADRVWYAAGDRSTDHNWYSKRALLSAVLGPTLLYWLDDRSEDRTATAAFLERRLNDVVKVGGQFGKTFGRLLSLPDRLFAPPTRLRRRHR